MIDYWLIQPEAVETQQPVINIITGLAAKQNTISNIADTSKYLEKSDSTLYATQTDISQFITSTLTDEEVQDKVGAMVTGNTETNITVTYQDADGTLDFVVSGAGGDVSKVGTPANNQVGVWTGDGTIEGDADFTFDGTNLSVTGTITGSNSLDPAADNDVVQSTDNGATWSVITSDVQLDQLNETYRTLADTTGSGTNTATRYQLVSGLAGKQAADADLTTYAGITPSANTQTLLQNSTFADWRADLDLEAGTDFYSTTATDNLLKLKADTLCYHWGVIDTVFSGQPMVSYKVESNITIVKVSSYTDASTVTFNLEERVATTPNTAGTDAMASDLVADTDQQEQTSFTNAGFAKNTWIRPTISAVGGDVSEFGITVWYIKQSY